LRDLEKNEFRSVGAEDFAAEMQELHNQIKERLKNSNQEYKMQSRSTHERTSV
jgi:hypothetical protein